MNDVINITNLLVSDGYDSYSFIHKSIQDFYAARFLSKRPDEVQKEFWGQRELYERNFCFMNKCLNSNNYYNFYVPLIIGNSSNLDKSGIKGYFNIDDVKASLKHICINFETKDFVNPSFKVSSVDTSKNQIDKFEDIYLRVVFNKKFTHPSEFLYHLCIDQHSLINERLSQRSFKRYLSRSSPYYSEISFTSFMTVFPEFDSEFNSFVIFLNKCIDDAWEYYQANSSAGINQEINAMTLIKNLRNVEKKLTF